LPHETSKKIKYFSFIIIIVLTAGFSACYKPVYYNGKEPVLSFSVDTILFDTVFSTVGSATKTLKVYNSLDKTVQLESVYLANGQTSKFRLNVDGIAGKEIDMVEIAPHDSIYVFAEVTIDPSQPLSASPFVVEDDLVFAMNGMEQRVKMHAWGQDANYLTGKSKGKVFITTCDMGTMIWDDPKPYVIYGTLLIDSCTVRIPEGTRIHVHGGFAKSESGVEYNDGQIYVLEHGKLQVEGSFEKPVVFATDRLEHKYDDISGLWSGIYILAGSKGNSIQHAVLKNANIGVYVDSLAELSIAYSKILHNITAGIYARHAKVDATNCLITDSGAYGVILSYGGEYTFRYCTIAKYSGESSALVLGNHHCLDAFCQTDLIHPVKAEFYNTIIHGSNEDEILFDNGCWPDYCNNAENFQYSFTNCLFVVKDLIGPKYYPDFFDYTQDCLNGAGENPLFIDPDKYDLRPDSLSIVRDKGIPLMGIEHDLKGNLRDGDPDIGCFEYREE